MIELHGFEQALVLMKWWHMSERSFIISKHLEKCIIYRQEPVVLKQSYKCIS